MTFRRCRARSLTPLNRTTGRARSDALRYWLGSESECRIVIRTCISSRLFYEADRGPRLATLPENRPRRYLVAPVCVSQIVAAKGLHSRVVRRFWDRPLGSRLILLLSIALLVEMGAPWQRICATTSGDEGRVCGWKTAYEGSNYGRYAAFLTGVLIVWELLPIMLPRLSMRGWPTAVISALLAIAVALFTLLKTINDNEFQTGWAWVGLGIALAIALTALLRVRFRWRTRDVRPAAEPEAEPRPE
jgi:hypothetical protein